MSATMTLRVALADRMVMDLNRAAEDLLGKAVHLAPVAEGTLRASPVVTFLVNGIAAEGAAAARAIAERVVRQGAALHVEATVAFLAVYAARQHEETGWRHPKGGQAKYLAVPLAANAAKYGELLELGQRFVIQSHPTV